MRTHIRLFASLALLLSGVAASYPQSMGKATDSHASFPPELNGTMMPYDFSDTDTVVPWGADQSPVFISYVSRHGARFLSSEKKVTGLSEVLHKAKSGGYLSPSGESFLGLLSEIDSVTSGNWGALNDTGIREEQRLGREMYGIAPELLKDGTVVARATYVPRVVMTMYELCHELARCSSTIEVTTMEGRQFDSLLRYFKTNPAYVGYLDNGAWKEEYLAYEEANAPTGPAASLFSRQLDNGKLRDITMRMYGVLQSLPAARIPRSPAEWFSEDEYRECWKIDNLRHYYQRSVSRYSDIPAQAATPLLKKIISDIDDRLSGKSTLSASMLFGHAETILPLFALMKLPGCYLPDSPEKAVADNWKDWEVSPLGANLMTVILKDSKGNHCAAIRLNGKWISIDGEKMIPWEKLRAYWSNPEH